MTNFEYIKTLNKQQLNKLLLEFMDEETPDSRWMVERYCSKCFGDSDETICDDGTPCPYFENMLTETILSKWLDQEQTFFMNNKNEYEVIKNENHSC